MRDVTKRITAKGLVLDYLKSREGWVASHEIESLSGSSRYMASNLSRRARELVGKNLVERKRVGKIEYFRYNTHRSLDINEANQLLRELSNANL